MTKEAGAGDVSESQEAPQTRSQTGVEAGESAAAVMASMTKALTEMLDKTSASIKSMTENVEKMIDHTTTVTQDITKKLDVGGDEAVQQSIVRHSDDVGNSYSRRSAIADMHLANIAQITTMGLSAAQVASNIAQFNAVSDAHQEGPHGWRKRCGEPPANPAEGSKG